jgi:hypothetical protein
MKSPENAYSMLNIFTEENLFNLVVSSENRLQIESDIPVNFLEFKHMYTQIQAEKIFLRNAFQEDKDVTQQGDKKNGNLIPDWVRKLSSLNELAKSDLKIDLKVVTALRNLPESPSIEDLEKAIEHRLRKNLQKNRKQVTGSDEAEDQEPENGDAQNDNPADQEPPTDP